MTEYDLVVVGGGIAALRAAIAAAESDLSVALISRAPYGAHHDGNIRDGLNAPAGGSQIEQFRSDALAAGSGLADAAAVSRFADGAVAEAVSTEHMGAAYARSADGGLQAFRLGQNSGDYSLRAGWWTGRAVLNALLDQAAGYAIDGYFEWLPLELQLDEVGVCGLTAFNIRSGQVQAFASGNVLLTEGAVGGLYSVSGNARHSAGTAQALAAAAGAVLLDPELVEFVPGLASNSPAAAGAVIGDVAAAAGARYAGLKSEPDGIALGAVARALDSGGGSRVDFSGCIEELELFAPELRGLLDDDFGAAVVPSAHFALGGIAPDTGIPGLHAAGEAAAGSLHGAGLLPGNALLDLLLSAKSAVSRIDPRPAALSETVRWRAQEGIQLTLAGDSSIDPAVLWNRLRGLMSSNLGLGRDESGLAAAADQIAEIGDLARRAAPASSGYHFNLELVRLLELRQGVVTAAAIAAGASSRRESRGPHQRADFPNAGADFADHSAIRFSASGWRSDRWAEYEPAAAEVPA
ncbi:MAG: FAD-binding protein [Chloroflexi bacterium]|nr:FAD-binding protein [Chloroflexota bacterium]